MGGRKSLFPIPLGIGLYNSLYEVLPYKPWSLATFGNVVDFKLASKSLRAIGNGMVQHTTSVLVVCSLLILSISEATDIGYLFQKSFPDVLLWWLRLRGPRNNICYSGHVKYFSDWLIDWLIVPGNNCTMSEVDKWWAA